MTERKLDIGCGSTMTPGYERADINPDYPALDYVCELDAIPVEDETFTEVRASHVIEHVPLERVRSTVLKEWLRVLKPGGSVWIDTPNIERNAELYLSDDWRRDFDRLKPEEQERCTMNGEPNRTLWLNFKVFSSEHQYNIHFWNADPELLTALLTEAGFVDVIILQESPSVIVQGKAVWMPK